MKIENKSNGCPHHNNSETSNSNQSIIQAQNHWHEKGNNGCIFSQVIAHDYEKYHWQKTIIDLVNEGTPHQIDETVSKAISQPEVRLLSLIFPSVKSDQALTALCEILSFQTKSIFLLEDKFVEQFVALSFRSALENGEVLSWIMGFGPFDSFAQTRKSPFTELVIPVKKKPDDTYHRHNQDKDSAHVADQHIPLDDKVLDILWDNTFKKTKKVLGHKPNVFSGARTTFTLPQENWQKKITQDTNLNDVGYEE